jgi:hypothetical protein
MPTSFATIAGTQEKINSTTIELFYKKRISHFRFEKMVDAFSEGRIEDGLYELNGCLISGRPRKTIESRAISRKTCNYISYPNRSFKEESKVFMDKFVKPMMESLGIYSPELIRKFKKDFKY